MIAKIRQKNRGRFNEFIYTQVDIAINSDTPRLLTLSYYCLCMSGLKDYLGLKSGASTNSITLPNDSNGFHNAKASTLSHLLISVYVYALISTLKNI